MDMQIKFIHKQFCKAIYPFTKVIFITRVTITMVIMSHHGSVHIFFDDPCDSHGTGDNLPSGVPPGAPAVAPLVALSAPRMLKYMSNSNQYLNSPVFFRANPN